MSRMSRMPPLRLRPSRVSIIADCKFEGPKMLVSSPKDWELVSAEFSDEEAGQQMTKQMREEQFQRTLAELEKMVRL